MRNIKSLIKDDDAGALSFCGLGICGSILGVVEVCTLHVATLCCPTISSLVGGSIGKIWGIAHTWFANCITA